MIYMSVLFNMHEEEGEECYLVMQNGLYSACYEVRNGRLRFGNRNEIERRSGCCRGPLKTQERKDVPGGRKGKMGQTDAITADYDGY